MDGGHNFDTGYYDTERFMLSNVEEIKSRLDIVDVISEFVQLRQAGANFKGLCPFHTEKTPSFMVSREKQFYKCFGCGEGGDMFSFLQKIEHLEFPEALKILAEKAGVQLVKQDPRISNLKTRLMDLQRVAAEFFQNQLQQPAGQMALKYLMEKRKLTVATLTEFKLGYAPNDWRATSNFLKARGFNDYEIKQSGMVVDKENSMPPYYDRFRHRLTFPILDHHGNIVGFTARALDENESAKYINTPQTLIYNKSQIVFGLDKAKNAIKEKDLAILVEGNMDVIASYQAGVKNVVAVSGTSLTFDQIKLIKRYSRNVALCFDTDAAGVAAGLRGIEMLWQEEMNIKIVILPTGYKDPDELVQKDVNQWQQATEQAEDLMEYLFAKNLQGNLKDLNAKRRAAKVLLPWMARLKDEIAQNHYLKLLAESIEISEDVLRQGIRQIRDKGQKGPVAPRQTEEQKEAAKFSRRELVAERFLALLLFYPLFLGRAAQILGEEHFSGLNQAREFYRELVLYYTKGEGTDKEILRENLRQRTAGKKELEDFFNTLELLAETEFETWSERELAHEFENGLEFLRRCFNDGKRMELQAKIKAAEKAGDMNLANQLLGEFAKIN